MSLLGGWFRSSNSSADCPKAKESLAKERDHLADALKWTALIMNDDIDGAWEGLERGESSFHSLGAAVTFFMRSILGFEKEVMAQAATMLSNCETQAWNEYKRAQKYGGDDDVSTSRMYPPGTEYELVRAETQLMSAVVGVLNESVVEAMKSFYKLRKAFIILDGIIAAEAKAHVGVPNETTNKSNPDGSQSSASPELNSVHTESESELDITDPIDVFIHSGANMCFGLIHVILSLVPPAFSRILSVVGFRGDRARGVRMLWRSASHDNIHGALAGLFLLAYYNIGTVDILPSPKDYDKDAEAVGPPQQKCRELLHELRTRYPDSRLWLIEEARLYANDKNLPRAIELLSTGKQSAMKQVTAVNHFELGINAMIMQKWVLMRDTFLLCLETSDWSPGMYYYLAGCAALELYRDAYHDDTQADNAEHASEVKRLKDQAEEYLRKVPHVSGKQRLMARQLPLEIFAQRKLQKWEARATLLGIDLADAVGSSPALEISYMWNGQKKMGSQELELALTHLDWSRCTARREVIDKLKTEKDDLAVWAIGMSSILQGVGKTDDAVHLLQQNVLLHDKSVFKGRQQDDYVLPVANYELAVIAWAQCSNPPKGLADEEVLEYRRAKADECQAHLERVRSWESYVLDARVGMRVQSGLETLIWFRRKMGWQA
ncbi:hypothetical protein E4U57_001677 [Claviceps arundinis]|uniref:Inclusion body clearance protein IML2 n=1 Tax=Claviceps arundinis TaxID=1623583 RepID=A0ABQ7PC20_9HYPO|nr:hypothetical protein E4U57_001677 [Claviceps arundinis]